MNFLLLLVIVFFGLFSKANELQTPVNFDVAKKTEFLTLVEDYQVSIGREYLKDGYVDRTLSIPKGTFVKVLGNFTKKTGLSDSGAFASCKIEVQYKNFKFYLSNFNQVYPMALTKEELDSIVKSVPCGNLPAEFGVFYTAE